MDWLSKSQGEWGARIQKLCETENLSLFAETEENYVQLLSTSGFQDIQMNNFNEDYARYNREIANKLQQKEIKINFQNQFGQKAFNEIVSGHQLIAEAIEEGELLIGHFVATK